MKEKYDWPAVMAKLTEHRAAGHSFATCAKMLGMSKATIQTHLTKHGIPCPPRGGDCAPNVIDWHKIAPPIEAAKLAGESYASACMRLGVSLPAFLHYRMRCRKVTRIAGQTRRDREFSRLWRLKTSYSVIRERLGMTVADINAAVERLKLEAETPASQAKYDWRKLDPIIIERLAAGISQNQIAADLGIILATLNRRILQVIQKVEPPRLVMPIDEMLLRNERGWIERGGAGPAVMRALAEYRV